jgi:phosphotransferase system enzyme I (PtsP)
MTPSNVTRNNKQGASPDEVADAASRSAVKGVTQPLLLLRQIRDVMGAAYPAQTRLDALVKVLASGLGCEVCSIYMLRAGDMLELFASFGLNKEAVHLTRLSVGEGLVGEIAATRIPLNLSEAREHPQFVYRPETGEENFRSFAGVPIVSGGRVVGVLVLQSVQSREFGEEEIELMQTVAMVLAELHASGQLVSLRELTLGTGAALTAQHLVGSVLSPGLVHAPAVLHRPVVEIRQLVADDPSVEMKRLERGLQDLQTSIDNLIREAELEDAAEQREIMESYRMFAHDKGWIRQLSEAVHGGLTAEGAVKKVQEQLQSRLQGMSSQYLRERMQDLDDLSQRLLQYLTGQTALGAAARDLPARFILVAHDLGPAEMLEYGRHRLKGIVLEGGAASSHIAIIARAMDIPVVGKVQDAMRLIQHGDAVIVDGDQGEVHIRPHEGVRRQIGERLRIKRRQRSDYAALRKQPAQSKDGINISLNMNIGLQVETRHLDEIGIDGVGLYRTELAYMASHSMPDVATQCSIYKEVLQASGGKRVIFRTFDIGADKQLPYFPIEMEANPALGWRASRIAIDRPIILRQQLRAMVQASAGRRLDVMFPFIAQTAELDVLRSFLDRELVRARQEGFEPPSQVRVGIMIEVPAILWQLPALLQRVHFISIGSNDLIQYLFAADRTNPRLSNRYDDLSPVMMQVVHTLVTQAAAAGVEVSFCGDMARKPLEAMALLGCGVRTLSAPPSAMGPLKAMVRALNVESLEALVQTHLASPDHSLRTIFQNYARDHGIPV